MEKEPPANRQIYCSKEHRGKVIYYNTEQHKYICEECAAEAHLTHVQRKIPLYKDLTIKANLFRELAISGDQLQNRIYDQITHLYEQFMKDIYDYKNIFIKKYFRQIFPGFKYIPHMESKMSEKFTYNLSALIDKIDITYEKMSEYSKEKMTNIGEIMKLEEPETLFTQLEELSTITRNLLHENLEEKMKLVKLEYKFDKNAINLMFGMKTPEIIQKPEENRFIAQLKNTRDYAIILYDLQERKSKEICINKDNFSTCGATCCVNNSIYIGGSQRNNEGDASFYVIEGVSGRIKKLHRMIDRRSQFCLLSNINELYAIGGFDIHGDYYLCKCEKYLIKDDIWAPLPSLNQGRNNHGSCYFQGTKEIYTFGGICAPSNSSTDSIERLKIHIEGKWIIVNLNQMDNWRPTRYILCAPISCTEIFIAGAANYIYDVQGQSMLGVDKPPQLGHLCNSNVSPTIYKGKLCFFNNANLNSILEYDIGEKTWKIITC